MSLLTSLSQFLPLSFNSLEAKWRPFVLLFQELFRSSSYSMYTLFHVQYSMAFKFRAEHPSFSFHRVIFLLLQIVTCYRSVSIFFNATPPFRVIIFPTHQSFFSSLFSYVSKPISLEGWKESLSGNFRQPVIFFNPDTALRGCPALRK